MRSFTKKISLAFFYFLQLSIFSLGVFLFTSTIKVFPWYEPLTMGAFMLLMFIAPIQVIMSLLSWDLYTNSLINKHSNLLSTINLGVILVALFTGIINQDLFYPLAKVCAITECILTLSYVVTILRTTARIRG